MYYIWRIRLCHENADEASGKLLWVVPCSLPRWFFPEWEGELEQWASWVTCRLLCAVPYNCNGKEANLFLIPSASSCLCLLFTFPVTWWTALLTIILCYDGIPYLPLPVKSCLRSSWETRAPWLPTSCPRGDMGEAGSVSFQFAAWS